MSYLDYGPDPELYVYKCSECNKKVLTAGIRTCLICNKKLCHKCDKDGFCTNHFNMFSPEGKEEFGRLVKVYKKKRIYRGIASVLVYITWTIMMVLYAINLWIAFSDELNILMLTFLSSITGIPPLLLFAHFFNKYNRKLEKKLKIGKINLFEEYKKARELITPEKSFSKKKKICQNCGRELKFDAKYCDSCGRQL